MVGFRAKLECQVQEDQQAWTDATELRLESRELAGDVEYFFWNKICSVVQDTFYEDTFRKILLYLL